MTKLKSELRWIGSGDYILTVTSVAVFLFFAALKILVIVNKLRTIIKM